MTKTLPRTADELRALVESVLSSMPEKQQKRFWVLMTDHPQNNTAKRFREMMGKMVVELCGFAGDTVKQYVDDTNYFVRALRKHRKPKMYAERDAEIMRLHGNGKKPGQICNLLKSQWPKLTSGAIRLVISRCADQPPE